MLQILMILPLILLITSSEISGAATANHFSSGTYEGLSLAVDRDGSVTGYFVEEQGVGVTKTCSFYIKGKATSDDIRIITWSDEVLKGKLRVVESGVELKIPEGREHTGCGLVMLPEIEEGIPFQLVRKASWAHLRWVPKKVALYSTASSEKPSGFLNRGEVVGVIAEKAGWLKVETLGVKKMEGWIPAGAAMKLEAPSTK